jgi:hypothetical protein
MELITFVGPLIALYTYFCYTLYNYDYFTHIKNNITNYSQLDIRKHPYITEDEKEELIAIMD